MAGYCFQWQSDANQFYFTTGHGTWYDHCVYGPVSAGVWYHLVGISASGANRFYVNGQLVSLTPATFSPSTIDLCIGYMKDLQTHFFQGVVDEVRIYNRALSASEIQQLYTLTSSCPTVALSPSTLLGGTVGVPYSQTITASGGTSPYSFAVSGGNLPAGLSLSSAGLLTGTPTAAGTYSFSVQAEDADGCTSTQSYTLAVSSLMITSVNVGPAGSGNLGLSIRGTGFGTTNAPIGNSYSLLVSNVTHGWAAGYAGDWVSVNVAKWTNDEIDITSFNLNGYQFHEGDVLQVQVQNQLAQNGWSNPYSLQLNQGALVVDIQPPSGYPMMLNNMELAGLQNALLGQLQQAGLCQANSTPIAVYVVANPPSLTTDTELALLSIALDAPYSIYTAASDLSEVGFLGVSAFLVTDTLGQEAAYTLLPANPVTIAIDVVGSVYGTAQSAQALDLAQGTCWSLLNNNNPGYQPETAAFCSISAIECNEHVRVFIPLQSLPQSTVDLRNILGNLFYGVVASECGRLSLGCGPNGFGPVNEEWYANGDVGNGVPAFEARIIDVLGNNVGTPTVPTSPPDSAIYTNSSPAGGGTITGGGRVYSGSTVTLSAFPTSCYTFTNWTVNGAVVSTSSNYTFTVTGTQSLVANFAPLTVTITTSNSPPDGGTTAGGGTVTCGSNITVVATPNTVAGYTFAKWTTNEITASTSASNTFAATSSGTWVAIFSPPGTQTITTVVSPSFAGATSGDGGYAYGTNVTVTATATNSCYSFVHWTDFGGTVITNSPSYTFAATNNQTLVASFALVRYSVITGSSLGGSTFGDGTNNCGSSVTVCAVPNPCYQFADWGENGVEVSSSRCYTFTANEDMYLVAHFIPAFSFGDGISDCWRLQYFGTALATNSSSCATCDADGTGQNNFFKYVAGLDPTNPASVFALKIASVTNQSKAMNLNFNPLALGRTYTPQFNTNLVSGIWLPLTTYTGLLTNGNQVTITDTNPIPPQEFYRIGISMP